jgi:uncharacterized spore protein YtfJ
MSVDEMIKQVTTTLEKQGNARAVFSEPIKLESHTVIPVATVGVGGAGATAGGRQGGPLTRLLGAGGGMGLSIRPVGFIHESGSEVVFTAIHLDGAGQPFLSEAATAVGRLARALTALIPAVRTGDGPKRRP